MVPETPPPDKWDLGPDRGRAGQRTLPRTAAKIDAISVPLSIGFRR
jgi:hypothetical protein